MYLTALIITVTLLIRLNHKRGDCERSTLATKKTPKRTYAPKTSDVFNEGKQYSRLVNIIQNTDTNKQAAARIGVSTSTLRRWIQYGISNRALADKKLQSKINRVSAGFLTYRKTTPTEQQKEYRPFSYIRKHARAFTKYWNVENASYEQVLDIMLRECETGIYGGLYFLIKFNVSFSGYFDGDTGDYYNADGSGKITDKNGAQLDSKSRSSVRASGSWIEQVDPAHPFLNTKLLDLRENRCNSGVLHDYLDKFYYMRHFDIIEVRFNEKTFKDDFYALPFD